MNVARAEEIFVSVVVTAYNKQNHIIQTLDRILAQKTGFPFEVLVGEDCSTDRTRELLQDYERKHPQVRVIYQPENQGVVKTFFTVVDQCKGTYVACCDGDDSWHAPDMLARHVDALEQDPEYGFVYSDYDLLKGTDRSEAYLASSGMTLPEGYIFEELLWRHCEFISASNVCFRKAIYDRHVDWNAYIERGFVTQDWPAWLEITQHCKSKYIPESFVTLYIIPDSQGRPASMQGRFLNIKCGYDICEYFINKYGCRKDWADDIRIRYLRTILYFAYRLRDPEITTFANKRLKELGHRLSLQDWVSGIASKNILFFFAMIVCKKLGVLNKSYF